MAKPAPARYPVSDFFKWQAIPAALPDPKDEESCLVHCMIRANVFGNGGARFARISPALEKKLRDAGFRVTCEVLADLPGQEWTDWTVSW